MFSLSSKPSDRGRAEYIASVEADKRRAEMKAERERNERLNFTSELEYPSLGTATKPVVRPIPLAFSSVASVASSTPSSSIHTKLPVLVERGGVRVPIIQEKEKEKGKSVNERDGRDGNAESDEINPDLFPSRRRGDKGTW